MEDDPIQLRLTIRLLENHIRNIEQENSFLKTELSRMMMTSVRRISSEESRAKWKYYHENKDRVAYEMSQELGVPVESIAWTCIKKRTDDAYQKK